VKVPSSNVPVVSWLKKRHHTSSLCSLFFGEPKSRKQKTEKTEREARPKTKESTLFLSFFTKKNSVEHLLTMADVQHERGYQKQVGVNVG